MDRCNEPINQNMENLSFYHQGTTTLVTTADRGTVTPDGVGAQGVGSEVGAPGVMEGEGAPTLHPPLHRHRPELERLPDSEEPGGDKLFT